MSLLGRFFSFFKRISIGVVKGVNRFLLGMMGVSSETDLISNEVKKSLVLLFVSFVVFFVFFVFVSALLLLPSPTVVVPNVVGDDILDALAKLGSANLVPSVEFVISEENPRGYVVRQIPSHGNIVREGKTVKLFVSIGSGEFVLPDFGGRPFEEVREFLSSKGVNVSIEYVPSGYDVGLVVRTFPSAGVKVKPGTPIVVYVSSGAEGNIPMPNMVGFTYENAMLFLDSKNIKFKITSVPTSEPANDGIVLDHLPREGEIITENVVPEIMIGVFGDETVAKNTRFILYKTSLSSFSKEGVNSYYIDIEVKDLTGVRTIKKVVNKLSLLTLPLKVRGVLNIKIYINSELVKEETL
ncbi:MAG: PASTA domain-containing protein [Brevinematia bacterium]